MQNIPFGQNYLRNHKLVQDLVRSARFSRNDIVIDIGAGKGIITEQLARYSHRVIAIEIDRGLFRLLEERFYDSNVQLVESDFLHYEPPREAWKAFANIPFNRSSDMIKRVLADSYFQEGYFILQAEAGEKFAGDQLEAPNSMLSVIWGANYDFSVEHYFSPLDFEPVPKVRIVLLKVERRSEQLLSEKEFKMFQDFVAYIFSKSIPNISSLKIFTSNQLARFGKNLGVSKLAIPSMISGKNYLEMFKVFLNSDKPPLVKGYYSKIIEKQAGITKVHRTRIDEDWREK